MQKAYTLRKSVKTEAIAIRIEGQNRLVNLIVEPVPEDTAKGDFCIVAFQDAGPRTAETGTKAASEKPHPDNQALEQELQQTKMQLQATVDDLESANEEMKSANEEYQSVNEELQSSNEELETAKEEMQSTNEELQTINSEMAGKNEMLTRLNSDLRNLLESTQIATLFLDEKLRIRSFTPGATDLFHLRDADRGRPITEIVTRMTYPDLQRDVARVLRSLSVVEREVEVSDDGTTFLMRIRPYRTVENVIDGVVFTFVDVTERKRHEQANARLAAIVESSDDAIIGKDVNGAIVTWNRGAERLFGYTAAEAVGQPIAILIPPERQREEPSLLRRIRRAERIEHFETVRRRKDGTPVDVALTLSPIKDGSGRVVGASSIARDIGERKRHEEARARLAAIVESSQDAIVGHSFDGVITSWNAGAEKIFGYTAEEAVGKPFAILLADEKVDEVPAILKALKRGQRVEHFEVDRVRKDGKRIDVSLSISPIRDARGKVVAASTIAREFSERRREEEHKDLLIGELNHRVKNTLAVVTSLVSQTVKALDAPEAVAQAVEGRIQALGRVHTLLTESDWDQAELRALIEGEMAPYRNEKSRNIVIGGKANVILRPQAVMALAMAFHELATNAAKYGALSVAQGRVEVTWNLANSVKEPKLSIDWIETGGPAAKSPVRRGFGSELIERSLRYDLGASVKREFPPEGLRCRIEFTLKDGTAFVRSGTGRK